MGLIEILVLPSKAKYSIRLPYKWTNIAFADQRGGFYLFLHVNRIPIIMEVAFYEMYE